MWSNHNTSETPAALTMHLTALICTVSCRRWLETAETKISEEKTQQNEASSHHPDVLQAAMRYRGHSQRARWVGLGTQELSFNLSDSTVLTDA